MFVPSNFRLVVSSPSFISILVMLHLELFGLFGLITPHPTHRPPPLSTAMSCSIGVQPTSTSIYDPWGASLSLWHADGQIEGLESMPPTFSTWDFPLGQDLYNPGLPLNTFHGPERSPKNDIGNVSLYGMLVFGINEIG